MPKILVTNQKNLRNGNVKSMEQAFRDIQKRIKNDLREGTQSPYLFRIRNIYIHRILEGRRNLQQLL